MAATEVELRAMRRAIELAATPGVPLGPNPRVGCLLLGPDSTVIAEGFHQGAGTPHAEAVALTAAGEAARGATAVVTLEPCNHTGRTGPCAEALVRAGVARVVFAQSDPNATAQGGRARLVEAGIDVEAGVLAAEAREINRVWSRAMELGRPFVTWKFAATLDGRSAATDGTSRWVSSPEARRDTHRLRALTDAILVGTGTVLADDPALTIRDEAGQALERQLLRVVMGERDIPATSRVFDDQAPSLHLRTRSPHVVLRALWDRDIRHLFLEGGPTVAAAFLRAGLVDEVVAYVAPMLLGAGKAAVADLGITTISDAVAFEVVEATVLTAPDSTPNVRFTLTPRQEG